MPFVHNEEIAQQVRSKQPLPPTRIAVEAMTLATNDGRNSSTEARLARLRKRIGTDTPGSSPCPKKANLAKLLGAAAGQEVLAASVECSDEASACGPPGQQPERNPRPAASAAGSTSEPTQGHAVLTVARLQRFRDKLASKAPNRDQGKDEAEQQQQPQQQQRLMRRERRAGETAEAADGRVTEEVNAPKACAAASDALLACRSSTAEASGAPRGGAAAAKATAKAECLTTERLPAPACGVPTKTWPVGALRGRGGSWTPKSADTVSKEPADGLMPYAFSSAIEPPAFAVMDDEGQNDTMTERAWQIAKDASVLQAL